MVTMACAACLQVASEDTVLFTAQVYADKLREASLAIVGSLHGEQLAIDKLAPLVRCPHLSQFWLSASVLSDDAHDLLLQKQQPQVKRLLLLKLTKTTRFQVCLPAGSCLRVTSGQLEVRACCGSWMRQQSGKLYRKASVSRAHPACSQHPVACSEGSGGALTCIASGAS